MRPRILFLLLLLVVRGSLAAQEIPTAPVLDFRLPVFSPEGFRLWELRGKEGAYFREENRIEISTLRLKVFSGDATETIENEVESPFAVALIDERKIFGPGQILVKGRGFEIRGEDWTYQETQPSDTSKRERTKSVVIRKNVVVTFAQDIGDILK